MMPPIVSRLRQLPLPAKALPAGVAFAALLSLALPAPGRGRRAPAPRSPQPAARAPIQAAPAPDAPALELASLRIGPEPMVAAPGSPVAATFVTDDAASCHVVATARLAAGAGPVVIRWTVEAPPGFQAPPDVNWTGPRLDVTLGRPGGNPKGGGGPLSITVEARALANGEMRAARATVVQDEIDQLRQEYIDLQRRRVPDRSEFIDAAAFTARYGRRYPWLHFEDLNWSVSPTTGLRYSYAILRPELLEGLDQVRRLCGSIAINSGYRNPVHQVEVHAPVRESMHQYGYAADLAVIPGEGRALPNEADWRHLAEVACAARAKWVEPLDSSAPDSPGCHVHLDYRPGPASSAPVHLHGQVVDAKSGRPVAGALVLLDSMPARTDANGVFGIRTVLSGGMHPIEVHAAGFVDLDQPVRLVAWGNAVTRLAVQEAPLHSFTVEVARALWVDRRSRLLAATLRVTNVSGAEVAAASLQVAPARATLIRQEPADLGALPAAAVRGVRVLLRCARVPTPEPLAVTLAYRGASGAVKRMRLAPIVVPPGATLPAAAAHVAQRAPLRAVPGPQAPRVARPATASSSRPARSVVPAAAPPVEPAAEPRKLPAPTGSAPTPAPAPGPAGPAPAIVGSAPGPSRSASTEGQKPAAPSSPPPQPATSPSAPAAPPATDSAPGSEKAPGATP